MVVMLIIAQTSWWPFDIASEKYAIQNCSKSQILCQILAKYNAARFSFLIHWYHFLIQGSSSHSIKSIIIIHSFSRVPFHAAYVCWLCQQLSSFSHAVCLGKEAESLLALEALHVEIMLRCHLNQMRARPKASAQKRGWKIRFNWSNKFGNWLVDFLPWMSFSLKPLYLANRNSWWEPARNAALGVMPTGTYDHGNKVKSS